MSTLLIAAVGGMCVVYICIDAPNRDLCGLRFTCIHTLQEKMKAELDASHRFGNSPIVTEITPASIFWPAEEYHQDYYVKSANRYKFYRSLSGRDEYIASVWGTGEASS